ncbi:MAG: FitA-like ribbon-helix-helix domain-containing protein [Jiangellaceae bacterium]
MATIQIREVPESAYEVIRRRARAAGQSIQAYMRDRVVELASRPTKGGGCRRHRGGAGRSADA